MAFQFHMNLVALLFWSFSAFTDASQLASGGHGSSLRILIPNGAIDSTALRRFGSIDMSSAAPVPTPLPLPTALPSSSAMSFRARAVVPWQKNEDIAWNHYWDMVLTTPIPLRQEVGILTEAKHTEKMALGVIVPCGTAMVCIVLCFMRPRDMQVASEEKDEEKAVEDEEVGRQHRSSNHTNTRSSYITSHKFNPCPVKRDHLTNLEDKDARKEDAADPKIAGKATVGAFSESSQQAVREEYTADPKIAEKVAVGVLSVSSPQAVRQEHTADPKIVEKATVGALSVSSQQAGPRKEDAAEPKTAEKPRRKYFSKKGDNGKKKSGTQEYSN